VATQSREGRDGRRRQGAKRAAGAGATSPRRTEVPITPVAIWGRDWGSALFRLAPTSCELISLGAMRVSDPLSSCVDLAQQGLACDRGNRVDEGVFAVHLVSGFPGVTL
jgi:hypothetical protein